MNALVKLGYKRTEVGIIPEDWDVTTIGQVVNDFRGGAPLKPSEFSSAGVRVLPKGGVSYGGLLQVAEDEWQYCSQSYADKHANNQVDGDYTIIILRDLVPSGPSIGLAVRISDSNKYVLAQGVYGFKVAPQKLDQGYIIQLSNTSSYRKLMNSIMVGSTQVHITNTAYKLAPIPLPPLPEQRAIAAALSDMDSLVSSLDQLIAKKRDIKQATMQKLLTGQIRLPGFRGEWKVWRLGDVARLNRIHVLPSEFPSQVFTHFSLPAFDEMKRPVIESGSTIGSNKFRVPEGAILVSKLNPRIPRVWSPPIIPENAVASTEFLVLTAKDGVSRDYLFVVCSSPLFCEQMTLSATGTTGSHQRISPAIALDLKITAPVDGVEQSAIATVISDIDNELTTLESRRDKARQLKQGMMQELLTGRIRLSKISQEELC